MTVGGLEGLILVVILVINLIVIAKIGPRLVASILGYFRKRTAVTGHIPSALEAQGEPKAQLDEWRWLVSELRSLESSLRRAPGLFERIYRFPWFYFGMNDDQDIHQAQQRVVAATHSCGALGAKLSPEQTALLNELLRFTAGDPRKLKPAGVSQFVARIEACG
jgi:hypothetical protein